MRHPSDYPIQEPRNTLGDHDHPPITASVPPRFTLDPVPTENGTPEWARNMALYGGLVGEDGEIDARTRRIQAAMHDFLTAQSSMLSYTYLALSKLRPGEAGEDGLRLVLSGVDVLKIQLEKLLASDK